MNDPGKTETGGRDVTTLVYVEAIKNVKERARMLSDHMIAQARDDLSEIDLQAIVHELLSISQSVQNIVILTNSYLPTSAPTQEQLDEITEAISGHIVEIKTYVERIAEYVLSRHDAACELEGIQLN